MLRRSLAILVGLLVALIPGTNPAAAQAAPTSICPPPNQALQGVDSPDRLLVLNPCQVLTGYVDASRLPQYFSDDGDIHNQFTPDPHARLRTPDRSPRQSPPLSSLSQAPPLAPA
jgi:hypothetical protein